MRRRVDLKAEIVAIGDLSRAELAEWWERSHGLAPTAGIRTELLKRSAAWHLQARHLGGFSAETRRLLKAAMARIEAKLHDRDADKHVAVGGSPPESATSGSPKRQRRKLTPGARLLRDWNGKTHVVDVIEGGFVFEAKVYPSLTAIAKTITGAHWSGPRFFAL